MTIRAILGPVITQQLPRLLPLSGLPKFGDDVDTFGFCGYIMLLIDKTSYRCKFH